MRCPECGKNNGKRDQYCQRCGAPLEEGHQAGALLLKEVPIEKPAPEIRVATDEPVIEVQVDTGMQPVPQREDSPAVQNLERPESSGISRANAEYPSFDQDLPAAPIGFWGPFASFGARRSHTGWLMDNQGYRESELERRIGELLARRNIPNATWKRCGLVERGLLAERRNYFIFHRGLVSLALYVSGIGNDLFVSLASYIKPPISLFRVLVLTIMVAFQLFMWVGFPILLSDAAASLTQGFGLLGGGPDLGSLLSLLCLVGPLGGLNTLAMVIFLAYSLYKWLTQKDFFAGLRVSPNEFDEDDLMAMDKAVESTVRLALDSLGLNPDDLKLARTPDRRWSL